jgi:hypothetical protein
MASSSNEGPLARLPAGGFLGGEPNSESHSGDARLRDAFADGLGAEGLDEATRALEVASTIDPRDRVTRNLLALAYFRSARFPEAARLFEELSVWEPERATHRLNLALAHLRAGKLDDAEPVVADLLSRWPEVVVSSGLDRALAEVRRSSGAPKAPFTDEPTRVSAGIERLSGEMRASGETTAIWNPNAADGASAGGRPITAVPAGAVPAPYNLPPEPRPNERPSRVPPSFSAQLGGSRGDAPLGANPEASLVAHGAPPSPDVQPARAHPFDGNRAVGATVDGSSPSRRTVEYTRAVHARATLAPPGDFGMAVLPPASMPPSLSQTLELAARAVMVSLPERTALAGQSQSLTLMPVVEERNVEEDLRGVAVRRVLLRAMFGELSTRVFLVPTDDDKPYLREHADAFVHVLGQGHIGLGAHRAPLAVHSLGPRPTFLRERFVGAYDRKLTCAIGSFRLAADRSVTMVRFVGDGRVALRLPEAMAAISLSEAGTVTLRDDTLVGWVGRVVTEPVQTEPLVGDAGLLRLAGDGIVLVLTPSTSDAAGAPSERERLGL